MVDPGFNVLDLDYADRQLVVVRPDEVVAHARQTALAAARDEVEQEQPNRQGGADGDPDQFAAAATRLKAWVKGWLNTDDRRGLPVLPITRTEARPLDLPIGHPLYDVVYVGNPGVPRTYYSLAEFHRQTFAHKFSEALNLLASLGAQTIAVTARHGWGWEFAQTLDVSVPLWGLKPGGRGEVKRSSSRNLLYTAELKGSGDPQLPKGLVWYPHESQWQSVAAQRIDFGLTHFTLHVDYKEDFSISADLAANVTRAGLKTGGSFHRHESTIWDIEAAFPPNESRLARIIKRPFS